MARKKAIDKQKVYNDLEDFINGYSEVSLSHLLTPFCVSDTNHKILDQYDTYTLNELITKYNIIFKYGEADQYVDRNYALVVLNKLRAIKSDINHSLGDDKKDNINKKQTFEGELSELGVIAPLTLDKIISANYDVKPRNIDVSEDRKDLIETFNVACDIINFMFNGRTLGELMPFKLLDGYEHMTPNQFLSMYCSRPIMFDLNAYVTTYDEKTEGQKINTKTI